MNFKAIIYMGAVLAVALLPSCKKDDDKTSTKDYLSGTFTFDIPVYLAAGQTVTLVPSGVTIPGNSTDAGLGYYWYSSWDSTRDTTRVIGGAGDGSWTIKTPLEIGCYKVTGVAFGPSEYYTSSGSVEFYVVDPSLGTTVSGLGIEKGDPHYLDLRDIKTYYTTEAGDLTWMNILVSVSDTCEKSFPYDYIIGRHPRKNGRTSVERVTDSGTIKTGHAFYDVSGNEMIVKVPMNALGLSAENLKLSFKVSDHVLDQFDIMDYYISGDSAPIGRLSYKYNPTY